MLGRRRRRSEGEIFWERLKRRRGCDDGERRGMREKMNAERESE